MDHPVPIIKGVAEIDRVETAGLGLFEVLAVKFNVRGVILGLGKFIIHTQGHLDKLRRMTDGV